MGMNHSSSQKKITILLPFFADGGMERATINLAQGFLEQSVAVDFVLIKKGYGSLIEEIPRGARVINGEAKNFLTAIPFLLRYIHHEKPAWILSLSTPANLISIFVKFLIGGRQKIIVSTQVAVRISESTSSWKTIFRPLIYRLYNLADKVHAVSKGVRGDLAYFGVRTDKIQVIYNPIISESIIEEAMENVPHPWFDEQREIPILLGVGRLVPQKDFLNLLRAVALVKKERSVRLIILGEGYERPMLENLARELKIESDISMPGFSNNPFAYMKHANLFVLSSAWEGFGNVLAESLALGTPVVSTDCPHGPSEILQNGRYGMLVPRGDSEALARAILTTLEHPLPADILREAATRFTIAHVTEEYLRVMDIQR